MSCCVCYLAGEIRHCWELDVRLLNIPEDGPPTSQWLPHPDREVHSSHIIVMIFHSRSVPPRLPKLVINSTLYLPGSALPLTFLKLLFMSLTTSSHGTLSPFLKLSVSVSLNGGNPHAQRTSLSINLFSPLFPPPYLQLKPLSPFLTHLSNTSLITGCFPDILKAIKVNPLLKKPTLNLSAVKYRPVSLQLFLKHLSVLSSIHFLTSPPLQPSQPPPVGFQSKPLNGDCPPCHHRGTPHC